LQVLRLNQLPVLSWRLPLRWYRRLTIANAVAIWMLIVLGGLVRVTESGEGCGQSWPMCHGQLIPHFEYHELIEWNHRLFAFLVGWLMVATVGSTLLWYRKPRRLMVFALLTAFTYFMQALLGAITVWLRLDQTWVAAHMGNSMLLMAAAVLLAVFARLGPVKLSESNRWLRRLALGTLVWTYLASLPARLWWAQMPNWPVRPGRSAPAPSCFRLPPPKRLALFTAWRWAFRM